MTTPSFESDWKMVKTKPSNDVMFTTHVLTNLRKILESEGVKAFNVFTDYERVALEDALLYLQQLNEIKEQIPSRLPAFMRLVAREIRRDSLSGMLEKREITNDEFTEIQEWFNKWKLEV